MTRRLADLKYTIVALALFSLAATGALAAAAGDGPTAAAPWTRYDWNASSGTAEKARFAIEEGGLLHIAADAADDARFVRTFPVHPDTLYRLSCRVRTEDVGLSARGAGISVSGILEGSPDIRGTSGWRIAELYGRTGAAQRELSVTVGVGGYGSLNRGGAWFDAVRVDPVQSAPAGVRVASLEPQAPAAPAAPGSPKSGWLMGVVVAFGLCLLAWGLFLRRRRRPGDAGRAPSSDHGPDDASAHDRPDRTDVVIMAALSVACLAVSLWHLGAHATPETGWQPAKPGESVTVELGRDVDLARIYYYCGINAAGGDGSRFNLAARSPQGSFEPLVSFEKADVGTWKVLDVNRRTSAVRLTAQTPGGRLNELAFVEKGSRTPLAGVRIGGTVVSPADEGAPGNLIDEQRAFEYAPSFRTGFYFDEIYFARTAWEELHGIEPYEWTHPPLGKLFIALGVRVFGMNPFGWRIMGALFGVALVPLLYLLGLKVFRNRFYAFCAAFLLLADFMRFAQTRAALIDVYGVFFILLMYYFILDLFPGGGSLPRRTDRSLYWAGLAFGFGAACKWIALYAGGGIVLLVLLRTAADLKRRAFPEGVGALRFLGRRATVCLLAFGVIPAAIYLLSYLPYLALPGPGHDLAGVLRQQANMLNYHTALQATHPFASPWWSWPLDLRPMWMYLGTGLPQGMASTIASFGNPAVWWLAIPAVAAAAFLATRRRDARLGVVLTALLFQYLPWVGIHRLAFIYHFFSAVPFVILCIVALLRGAERHFRGFRAVTWGYLAVTATVFLIFYPVLSGVEVSGRYVAALQWLPTWLF